MHMSMSMNQRQEHRMEQKAIPLQRQMAMMSARQAILEAIHGERYRPNAVCPACSYRLTLEEALRGFRDDPDDISTRCPKCAHRFIAALVAGGAIRVEVRFLCRAQTLARLEDNADSSPDELRKDDPSTFQSALLHFGGIRAAFAAIDLAYAFEEVHGWEDKINGFLGKVPDVLIAECVGKPVQAVRKLRRSLKIAGYKRPKKGV